MRAATCAASAAAGHVSIFDLKTIRDHDRGEELVGPGRWPVRRLPPGGNGGHSVSAQQKKANIGDEQKERLAMRECDGG
jgi:hypothetical protein